MNEICPCGELNSHAADCAIGEVEILKLQLQKKEAQLAEARKDSERLDWFNNHDCDVIHLDNGNVRINYSKEIGDWAVGASESPTIREAIDKAMKRLSEDDLNLDD